MNFRELKIDEFEKFAYSSELFTFHQTKEWANLKKKNGWDSLYVGLEEDNKIVAAALILVKMTPIKKKIFYSPRGFLIDYKNEELVKKFTREIKKYAKENGAMFIKIDPYLLHLDRDVNGDLVEEGIDNSSCVDYLKELGYKHYGYNIDTEKELQPRWMHVLDFKSFSEEEVFASFSSDTKRYINRCSKFGLVVEEIGVDKIDDFRKIMEHTSIRRGFIDRPLSYYKNMMEILGDHIKVLCCYMNTDIALSNIQSEYDELLKEKEDISLKLEVNPDSKKSKVAMKNVENKFSDLEKRKNEIEKLIDQYGKKILMASSMFIIYPTEVLYLYSGSFDEFMKYNPQYLIQWNIIKYAINNKIPRYNFYGIDGNFSKDNKMYGIYEFKKGFGGNVKELIGEFDLIINPFFYSLYNLMFKTYKNVKKIKNKVRGN